MKIKKPALLAALAALVLLAWCGSRMNGRIKQLEEENALLKREAGKHNIVKSINDSVLSGISQRDDLGYAIVNGPLYIAPGDELTAENACEWREITPYMGELVHIETLFMFYSAKGGMGVWAQVSILSDARRYPKFWIAYSDLLPYNEETKSLCTGPFKYTPDMRDAVSGEPVPPRLRELGPLYLASLERGTLYLAYPEDDPVCSREKGIAAISFLDSGGYDYGIVPNLYLDVSTLSYPDPVEYGSSLLK